MVNTNFETGFLSEPPRGQQFGHIGPPASPRDPVPVSPALRLLLSSLYGYCGYKLSMFILCLSGGTLTHFTT